MSLTTSTLLGGAALLVTAVAVVVPPAAPQTISPASFGGRAPAAAREAPAAAPGALAGTDRPAQVPDPPAGPGSPVPAGSTGAEQGLVPGPPGPPVDPPAAGPGFHWPLAGHPVVGRRFSVGPHPWSPGHRGVDLAAGPGAQVLAPGSGTVRFSGKVVSRGVLTLDHGNGLLTSYEPVRVAAGTGTRVRTGQVIGWITPPTGHCPVDCLHWGARRDGQYIDPLTLLAAWRGPPILLPVG